LDLLAQGLDLLAQGLDLLAQGLVVSAPEGDLVLPAQGLTHPVIKARVKIGAIASIETDLIFILVHKKYINYF